MKRPFLLLFAFPICVFAEGGLPSQPYLYVEGKSEIERPADLVTLRFDLVARNTDQAKANQEVQAKATKLLAVLDERKIAQNDVVATDLRSEPQYEREDEPQSKRGKIVGYRVTRSFTTKVREIAIFPNLVDDLLAVGGVEFSGVDVGLAKEKELREEEWDKALGNAREWAERTLKPTGMKIDSVYALSPVPFPEIQQKMLGSNERVVVTGSYAGQAQVDPTKYRLDTIKVSQSVHVIYLISAAK
ncbi:MAG: SIMPL domain-containing protein [Verrucomicrobiota bacterium]|nr:SIMPL domain-containing protein [Verrucomicrobiota bacterium]